MSRAPVSARPDRLAPSLLDRLIDTDPELPHDPPISRSETLNGLREAVRRDLAILLNTRCRPTSPPDGLPVLEDSLVGLGVEDFFNASLVTDEQRRRFAARIEWRIARFEPRLEDLSVSLLPMPQQDQRALRLRITARFRARPGLPPVSFETRLDPATHGFTVISGARHA
ncbi:type VI secretion system baseplate subunit TssE [Ruegeria jejuensis]|uniref:type VI secretion system baseplate subunit TssE n=1 Tax=Ruegeria jejuensis TaxID=3233338 RepID=UPI00355B8AD0